MIRIENLTKIYGKNIPALDNVNLNIKKGQCCLITGPAGAGKTTLLNVILATVRPTHGRVFIRDREITAMNRASIQSMRRHTGVVFQDLRLLNGWSVFDNIGIVLELQGRSSVFVRKRVWSVLRTVGLQHRVHYRAGDLSGGERQRLALARAIVHDPDIILADEPEKSMDEKTRGFVGKILLELSSRGTTVIMVSHHSNSIPPGSRMLHMEKGSLSERPWSIS